MDVNCDPIAHRLTLCVFAAALATAVGGARLRAQDSPCSKQRAVTGDRSQLEACRAMVATDPSNADARNALAIARAQANDYPGAISAWRAYLRLRPTDYEAYQNLGLMYEISQQPDSALAAFRAVLELPADSATVQNVSWHIGVAYANTGRDSVALAWFKEAAAIDSTDAAAWHYAGLMASRLKRYREAMTYWARMERLVPDLRIRMEPADRAYYDLALKAAGRQPLAVVSHSGVRENRSP